MDRVDFLKEKLVKKLFKFSLLYFFRDGGEKTFKIVSVKNNETHNNFIDIICCEIPNWTVINHLDKIKIKRDGFSEEKYCHNIRGTKNAVIYLYKNEKIYLNGELLSI